MCLRPTPPTHSKNKPILDQSFRTKTSRESCSRTSLTRSAETAGRRGKQHVVQRLPRGQIPHPEAAVRGAGRQAGPVQPRHPRDALGVALQHVEAFPQLFLFVCEKCCRGCSCCVVGVVVGIDLILLSLVVSVVRLGVLCVGACPAPIARNQADCCC